MSRLLGSLLLLAAAAPAFAAETVSVVGTRALTPDEVSISGAEIGASGATGLGALLGQLPAFGGQGVNDAQDDNGFGEAFVDLRNLNFNRTLVLVDGTRFVLSGIQTDEAVDLNTIPAPFVERIEVHADGTQPQLSADAVAGAVDVRLRRTLEGTQMQAYGGAAGAGDAGTAELSVLAGHGDADGHLTIGVDGLSRDPILQSDRGWARAPITGFSNGMKLIGSAATPGGHAVGDGVDDVVLGGGAIRPFDAAADNYDFAGGRYLQGGLRRASVMVAADRTLGAGITGSLDLIYTDRRATTLLPPETLGLGGTALHPDGFVVPAANAFNPFGEPVTLERVVSEAGAQRTTTTGPVWRVTAGLRGDSGGWHWHLTLDHGQSLSRYVTTGAIDLTRALQTVGVGSCVAAQGCVPADWFGPGNLSPAALAYVSYAARSQSGYAETVADGSAERTLFQLSGGAARLIVGGELRREDGYTSVDPVTRAGDQAGDDAAPTAGGYDTQEGYVSVDLPIVRNKPGAALAEVQLAARGIRTSRYGSFPALRAEVDYAPVPGVTLQAVTGTARRPPAIAEAFGGISDLDLPVTDPCDAGGALRRNPVVDRNCRAAGLGSGFTQTSPLIDVASGGNAALHPEQSENEMLGATLQPDFLPGATFRAAWWHYRIADAIDSLADTDTDLIPDECYESMGLSSPSCALVSRIPGGGNAGQISRILALDENVGTIKTQGIDASVTVVRDIAGLGRLTAEGQATWLLDYRIRTAGQPGFVQYAGTFPSLNAVGSYARLRARTSVGITRGNWSLGWTGRIISGARVLESVPGSPDNRATARRYDDVDGGRAFGRLTISAGIQNLADTRPPTLLDGETNTDTATYDVVGRFVWMRIGYAM